MRLSPFSLLAAVLIGVFGSINALNDTNPYYRYPYHPSLIGGFFKLRGRINERLGEITDNVIGGAKNRVRNGVNNVFNYINGINDALAPLNPYYGTYGYNPSGNTQAGNTQSGNTQSGNTQSGNTQSGNTQSGNTQSGNTQSGNTQSGNTQSGNTQSGNTQSGNTQSGNTHYERPYYGGPHHGLNHPGNYQPWERPISDFLNKKESSTNTRLGSDSGLDKDDEKKLLDLMNRWAKYYILYTDRNGNKKRINLEDIIDKNNNRISEEKLKIFLKTVDQIQNIAELEKDIYNVRDLYDKIDDLERTIDKDEELKILSSFQSRLASRAQEKDLENAVNSIKNIASKLDSLKMLDSIQLDEITDSVSSLNSVVAEIKNLKNVESLDNTDTLVTGLLETGLKKANSVAKKIQDYVEFVDLDKIVNTNIGDKDKLAELKKDISEADLKTLWGKLYQPPVSGAAVSAGAPTFADWKMTYTDAMALKDAEKLDYYQFAKAIKDLNGAEFNATLDGLNELINSGKPEDYIKSLEKIGGLVKKIPAIETNWAQIKKFGDAPKNAEELIKTLDQLKDLQKNLKSADNYKETLQMFAQISAKPRVREQLKQVVEQLEKMSGAIIDNSDDLAEFTKKLDKTLEVMASDKAIDGFTKNVAELRKETNMIDDVPNLRRELEHVEKILDSRELENFNKTLQRVKRAVKKPMELMRLMKLLNQVKSVAKTSKDLENLKSKLKAAETQAKIESEIKKLDEALHYVNSPSLTGDAIEKQKKVIAKIGELRKIFDEDDKLLEKLDKIRTLDEPKVKKHKKVLEKVKGIKDKDEDKKEMLNLTAALKKKSWDDWNKLLNKFETKDVTKADILDEMKYSERFTANKVADLKTELKI